MIKEVITWIAKKTTSETLWKIAPVERVNSILYDKIQDSKAPKTTKAISTSLNLAVESVADTVDMLIPGTFLDKFVSNRVRSLNTAGQTGLIVGQKLFDNANIYKDFSLSTGFKPSKRKYESMARNRMSAKAKVEMDHPNSKSGTKKEIPQPTSKGRAERRNNGQK